MDNSNIKGLQNNEIYSLSPDLLLGNFPGKTAAIYGSIIRRDMTTHS